MQSTTKKTLKIGCWNTRGLSAADPFLRMMLDKNDVFMISEHWLHNNCLNDLDDISSDFYNHGRASKASPEDCYGLRRGQGGVAIFWRKNLTGVSILQNLKHDRICGIRIEVENGAIIILLSVYMPAAGSRENLGVTLDELSSIIDGLEENAVPIICGDLNGNMGYLGGPQGRAQPTRAGSLVAGFCPNTIY